ncbi:carbohydrate ABC transporter permease [Paenibacillus eucommiae]|uniref:ABC-type glycerol-3-phosphate transport system permease component n=1 Tax=Paenibacillus eucommiae TaxID=1355755 RepID=A0ABS4IN98_9BACL|nr:carbohydrate ABC transporter permease [Paenibacillus eucommiae]MBP1988645.1 ABC-type glycerol-3-phosphate transport system permease component [Paenibacillus eucommiae]
MVFNKSERIFQGINNVVFLLVSLTMIAPLINLLAISLSSPLFVNSKRVLFWPKGFNVDVYETIFGLQSLWRAMGVSVWITVVGTALTLFLGSSLSYALSRRNMKGRTFVLQAVVITFIFTSPLIPTYLLVSALGLKNTLWALIVPSALSAFYVLIIKTFFEGISAEIFESAKMDGCTELKIYYRIVLPLSKPVMATIALFHAVFQWNSYFGALMYITARDLLPLQIILRNMVIEDQAQKVLNNVSTEALQNATPEMMKAGVILFATLPILIVYPFLQRYFVKGAMLGSVKE